ncbi:MAG TPA: TolC family protein, partial [Clostridium sp.]
MRKNLNKIVAFAIGISVVSGSFMPVFAADNAVQIDTMINSLYSKNQKLLLTLDDAIKGAV